MDETCHYCGQPARLFSKRIAVPTTIGLVHARCYHERADETWEQMAADGSTRKLTSEEAAEHRAWARGAFPVR